MEDRETPRMRRYGESKTTRIMMATVPHVTSGSGITKFEADGFLFDRVYQECVKEQQTELRQSAVIGLNSVSRLWFC
jgi:hypothetical protein